MSIWNDMEQDGIKAGDISEFDKVVLDKGEYNVAIQSICEGTIKIDEIEQPCIKIEWLVTDGQYQGEVVRQNLKIHSDKESVRKRALTLFCNIDANAGNILRSQNLEPTNENLCQLVNKQMVIGIDHVEIDGKVENHFVSKILLNQ